ncbi:hypothetical protein HK405_008227 [Cladochytrium tenue]|nr:hypothetical protein HK405_008227 [Cladochytrium tenue]
MPNPPTTAATPIRIPASSMRSPSTASSTAAAAAAAAASDALGFEAHYALEHEYFSGALSSSPPSSGFYGGSRAGSALAGSVSPTAGTSPLEHRHSIGARPSSAAVPVLPSRRSSYVPLHMGPQHLPHRSVSVLDSSYFARSPRSPVSATAGAGPFLPVGSPEGRTRDRTMSLYMSHSTDYHW